MRRGRHEDYLFHLFHTKQLTAEYDVVLLENRLLFACLICLLISLKFSDLNEFKELKVHILLINIATNLPTHSEL